MSETLTVLENQYLTLKRSLSALLDACKEEKQRQDIRTQYSLARGNFWAAQNKVLDDNDPKVREAAAEAVAAQQQMQHDLENLQDVAKALDTITSAVGAGTRLVTMLGV